MKRSLACRDLFALCAGIDDTTECIGNLSNKKCKSESHLDCKCDKSLGEGRWEYADQCNVAQSSGECSVEYGWEESKDENSFHTEILDESSCSYLARSEADVLSEITEKNNMIKCAEFYVSLVSRDMTCTTEETGESSLFEHKNIYRSCKVEAMRNELGNPPILNTNPRPKIHASSRRRCAYPLASNSKEYYSSSFCKLELNTASSSVTHNDHISPSIYYGVSNVGHDTLSNPHISVSQITQLMAGVCSTS